MGRWTSDQEPVPERLARYVEAEWPGDNPLADFSAAARAWLEDNPGRRLPYAADPVEVLQHVVQLKTEAPAGSRTAGPGWRSPFRPSYERGEDAGPWRD